MGFPISSPLSIFRSTLFASYRVIIMHPQSLNKCTSILEIVMHDTLTLLCQMTLREAFQFWILHYWQIVWHFLQEILLVKASIDIHQSRILIIIITIKKRKKNFWCFTFSRAKGWSLATNRTRYSMMKAFEKYPLSMFH